MAESLKVTKDQVSNGGSVKKEFDAIAEYIVDEMRRREKSEARKDLDRKIKEIDRQVAMIPKRGIKRNYDGSPNKDKAWMSELEPPNQRQALEMNTADARRLLWPDTGSWFEANAEMTDKYLKEVQDLAMIAGDENETRSSVNQEIVNEIVETWLLNVHRSYNFRGNMDIINSESFKYGTGVGRGKMVKTPFFSQEIVIPQLVPVSLKHTYLDDSKYNLMNEGIYIEAGQIRRLYMRWEDLVISAQKGIKDPDDQQGGWIPANLAGLEPAQGEEVELIEYEGDIIVPVENSSLYLPRVIVTVAVGGKSSVIRYRNRKSARSSYFLFPYHVESVDTPYAVGPLVMGHPIQCAAAEALNTSMDAAALSTLPQIFYDGDDPNFLSTGGPNIRPGGSDPSLGEVREISPGDPGALFQIYMGLTNQYAELTGMTGARLGAQTSSHTTAYAKNQEVARGQIRIVDYIKSTMQGPLSEWLQYCYGESLDALGSKSVSVYMHKSRSFINISKKALPKNVFFDIMGAAGPQEDAQKVGAQIQAMQMVIGLETMKRQLGEGDPININAVQKEFLRKGGLIDVDKFYETGAEGAPPKPEGAPAMGGAGGGDIGNSVPAALQTILAQR